MEFVLSNAALEALHPFSCLLDSEGRVVWVGRSLSKVLAGARLPVVGRLWSESFEVERPEFPGLKPDELSRISGQLLVLRLAMKDEERIRFRGQLVPISNSGDRWLFALSPSVKEVGQMVRMGLSYPDFPAGDPVFDFLMLLQSERRAFEKSEISRRKLVFENQVSALLHQLALISSESQERDAVLGQMMERVCLELGWEFAHLWIVSGPDSKITSSGKYFCADQKKLGEFARVTLEMTFEKGRGLPGRVLESEKLVWIDDVAQSSNFPRARALPSSDTWCGVGIPILLSGKVVAVLDFFTSRLQGEKKNLVRFFETLSTQLSSVTERQEFLQREREQEATLRASANLSSLGEMAAGISHEIANPLTAVALGSSQARELIARGTIDPRQLDGVLERVERAAVRIQKIITGMRTLSRDGRGDPLVAHRLDLIVEDTLSVCSARFRNAGILLEVLAPDEVVHAMCRPVQIGQVVLNLLNNAYDAVQGTDAAWVRVTIRREGSMGMIEVSDSGPGIPADVAAKIMQPFFTTKTLGKGTGLGLSISRSIASAHGGSLDLDPTRPNTTFVLRLPLPGDPFPFG